MYYKSLKDKLLYCLEKYPDTRNSDIALTNRLWVEFFNPKLMVYEGSYYVKLSELYDLPSQDDVKRVRAIIQNKENRYLPTSEEVRKNRKIMEENWLKWLGKNPEMRTP